jgi:hypothetical protein
MAEQELNLFRFAAAGILQLGENRSLEALNVTVVALYTPRCPSN